MSDIIRIANCSGFYGDKLSAARQMAEGGPIDILTGDYLAELTMSILYGQRMKDAEKGYVGTFLKQLQDVASLCLEKKIKIVSNAGGLNPKGMAEAAKAMIAEMGLRAKVAYIEGDDLTPRMTALTKAGESFQHLENGRAFASSDMPTLTANVYLGGWGIKEALDQGADIVICPRVTDAALAIGPAAWRFQWKRDDYDKLAGALAAGHIIECGAQTTGGNYAFFQEVPTFKNIGYPIAEIEEDGSFTITKHPHTGGLVSKGTVTAQLLYEIAAPAYVNPDVVAHFDTLAIEETGQDRVRVSGCRGSSPPKTHKVCINRQGGFKNGMEILLAGLDVEEKAKLFADTLFDSVGGREQFDEVAEQIVRSDKEDPKTNEEAFGSLRIQVKSKDPKKAGRLFSAKIIELALANIPGFTARGGAGAGGAFAVHWPALVKSEHIAEHVHVNGQDIKVKPTSELGLEEIHYQRIPHEIPPSPKGETARVPFGRLFGTRSGDKGGAANLGVWAKSDPAYGFLHAFLTAEKLKILLPDAAAFRIERFDLPNLRALNFVIHGILGDGAAASTRLDGQAKSLGEYLRAKYIEAPKALME